jgi:hypothetical protein
LNDETASQEIFTTSLFLVTLVLMEVAVRFWGYSEHHIYDPIYMPFAQTKDIPYIHKPNLVNVRARGMAIINTDSYFPIMEEADRHH